jgi:holo-[acyl-carrier protein] synthase
MSHTIGLGTDITECLRIAKMIDRHAETFIERVYTSREAHYCRSQKQSTESFAGRWCAKEAILKALGTGWRSGISWRDMEILNDPAGRPVVELSGGALEVAEQLGITEILITISHCHTHATATAIAVGERFD